YATNAGCTVQEYAALQSGRCSCSNGHRVKVVVATDRSETARQAVAWAADLAQRFAAELVLLQVLTEEVEGAEERLREDAAALNGARAVVRVGPDVAEPIVRAAEGQQADLRVVGTSAMGGRREFLLGTVPTR